MNHYLKQDITMETQFENTLSKLGLYDIQLQCQAVTASPSVGKKHKRIVSHEVSISTL